MSFNNTTTTQISSYTYAVYDIHEILFVLFCVLGVSLDVITTFTILRFKKLQSANNIFIANWAVIDILSLLVTPSAYGMIEGLEHVSTTIEFTSGYIKMGILLHSAVIMAMLLVTFDWCLSAYFPNVAEKFHSYTTFVLAIFWALTGICSILSLFACRTFSMCIIDTPVLLLSFGSLAVFVVVLNLCRVIQKCRKNPLNYPAMFLNVSTIFAITWSLGFYNISHVRWYVYSPFLSLIMDVATFSSPVVNFIILYHFNPGFKECLREVFKRADKNEEHYYQFKNPIVITNNMSGHCEIGMPKEQLVC